MTKTEASIIVAALSEILDPVQLIEELVKENIFVNKQDVSIFLLNGILNSLSDSEEEFPIHFYENDEELMDQGEDDQENLTDDYIKSDQNPHGLNVTTNNEKSE